MENKLILLLHFYQPPTQTDEVVTKVCKESYFPVLQLISECPNISVLVNIQGCLLERLSQSGNMYIVDLLKSLVDEGKVSLLRGLYYHPVAALMPLFMIDRQFLKQDAILEDFFKVKPLNIFYPPELYVSEKVLSFLENKSIDYLISPAQSAYFSKEITRYDNTYSVQSNTVKMILRDDYLSNLLTLPKEMDKDKVISFIKDYLKEKSFSLVVLDVELIGHHLLYKYDLFKELFIDLGGKVSFSSKDLDSSDNINIDSLNQASWESIIEKGQLKDVRWKNNSNPIHKNQWLLFNLFLDVIDQCKLKGYSVQVLEDSINFWSYSCQFWWASAYPFWHPGKVLEGAEGILKIFYTIPDEEIFKNTELKALEYYKDIIKYLYTWERKGINKKLISEYDKSLNKRINFYENLIHIV